jgi:PAS domain S-box-containing protein
MLIIFVASISIYNSYSLNRAVDGLIESNYKSIEAARNMLDAIERQDGYLLLWIQMENDDSIKNFYENQKKFLTWLTKAKDNITQVGENRILDDITQIYMDYTELNSKLHQIRNTIGIKEASNFYSTEIFPVFLSVKQECNKLLEINEVAMFDGKANATHNSKYTIYITSIISLFVVILGFTVASFYTRRIVKPMHKLIVGVKHIREGNLEQEIVINTKDEVGELAIEFNNMTKRLLLYEKSNIKNLIAEKNKSLAIVKSITDPVVVTDNMYNVTLVNKTAESFFNIKEKESVGRHFLESINNMSIFNKIKSVTEGRKKSFTDNSVLTINNEDKNEYYILTSAPIYDNEEAVTGAVTVFQDITELKRLEQIKTDFIATISHELRTPLTSIIMGTELLNNEGTGSLNSDQKEIIQAMDEDSKQLMALVNDLLDLSKLESGKIKMNYNTIDIEKILKQAVRGFIDVAEEKGVSLWYDISEKLPNVSIDVSKIVCVINNLIVNALKFTKTGDEIKVIANRIGDFIRITVADTGSGIPEEYQKAIFERFVQVDNPQYNDKGSGLGLAISKEFIKRHGGEIWVESKLGEGSKFIFTLPI